MYWVNRTLSKIKALKNNILIADCRFLNEVEAIKSIGGKIIKIDRLDMQHDKDSHVSEEGIDSLPVDLTLGTLTNKYDLQKRVAYLIAWNKEEFIFKYDYHTKVKPLLDDYINGLSLAACSVKLGVTGNNYDPVTSILTYYNVAIRNSTHKPHQIIKGIETKQCSICKQWHPLNNFGLSSRTRDNLTYYCKSCRKASDCYQRYTKINTLEKIVANTKKTAKQRNIDFFLTLDEVKHQYRAQQGYCFYSGKAMTFESGPTKLTIDRTDNSLGYMKENIVLACYISNMMKNKLSITEFFEWIECISLHRKR